MEAGVYPDLRAPVSAPGGSTGVLADAVEDAAEGAYKDLPYAAFAQAAFALIMPIKKVGIIPDSVLHLGRADDRAWFAPC